MTVAATAPGRVSKPWRALRNRSGRLPRTLTLLATVVLLASCGEPEESVSEGSGPAGDDRPNIVVVCVDTLRADHCSLYGYSRPTTPNLERLAAEGFVARCFFANAPWTKPSVASYYTGLLPSAHGSRVGMFAAERKEERTVEVLSDRHTTLAEALAAAGYRTAAYTTNFNMAPKFGYAQGFEDYGFVAERGQRMVDLDAEGMQFGLEMLQEREQDGAPRFLWLHLMSVHQYASPDSGRPFRSETSTAIPREARQAHRVERYPDLEAALDAYDHSILYVDRLIGKFFDAVRERSDTVLVVLADHGEEFLDHGGFEHGATLFREQLAVPFVAWGPGVPKGEMAGIADSLDLFPTLCALAGADCPDPAGQGMFEPDGGVGAGKEQSFAEQHQRTRYRRYSLLWDDRKLIREIDKKTGEADLRVLLDARAGGRPVAPRYVDEERLAPFLAALEEQRAKAERTLDEKVGEVETLLVTDEDLERLRALGYARREGEAGEG